MNDLYAMRRANGDWFAFDVRGRLRVPVFQSSEAAVISRLRNFEMLLFKPVALDAQLLQGIVPANEAADVDFCMIKDPRLSLKRGTLVEQAQLSLQMPGANGSRIVPNGKSSRS